MATTYPNYPHALKALAVGDPVWFKDGILCLHGVLASLNAHEGRVCWKDVNGRRRLHTLPRDHITGFVDHKFERIEAMPDDIVIWRGQLHRYLWKYPPFDELTALVQRGADFWHSFHRHEEDLSRIRLAMSCRRASKLYDVISEDADATYTMAALLTGHGLGF